MKKILIGTNNDGNFKELSFLLTKRIKKITHTTITIKTQTKTIKFFWDKKVKGVRRTEGYVWMANEKSKPYLRKYQPFIVNSKRKVGKFDWKDKKIVNAYKIATGVVNEFKKNHEDREKSNS